MARLTQEQLLEIFNALKKEIKPYEKGTVKARIDIEGKYDLWSEKENIIAGRLRKEMNFVTIILQSNYVGFYYMPIYTNCDAVREKLSPELLKQLKGKACFHITKTDESVIQDIKQAMKVGYDVYKKNGWV